MKKFKIYKKPKINKFKNNNKNNYINKMITLNQN